ncbi:formylglycine-generating enzyme family protein [Pendulispora albinea]|uniref:Formylglycine-generating enzyme family protein n=1 Tax=Pendulispora albinea TaxID=2741071 RepID=A0ABZ2LMT9_9BACT
MKGPKMVRVGNDAGGDASISFCIDSTEVTREQYDEFLSADGGGADKALEECSFNLFYQPYQHEDAGPPPNAPGSTPVVYIDWCDAYAYCAWAGKRLCGRIGKDGLTLGQSSDPRASQWTFACSAGGSRNYPYGNSYEPGKCNDGTTMPRYLAAIDEYSQCTGGVEGLLAMSGNAYEWENACDYWACHVRGGSYQGGRNPDADSFSCKVPAQRDGFNRRNRANDVGFRCCSNP